MPLLPVAFTPSMPTWLELRFHPLYVFVGILVCDCFLPLNVFPDDSSDNACRNVYVLPFSLPFILLYRLYSTCPFTYLFFTRDSSLDSLCRCLPRCLLSARGMTEGYAPRFGHFMRNGG